MKLQDIVYAVISAAITGSVIIKALDVDWTFAAFGALCAATTIMVLARRHRD